jgi:hypothetical protein
MVVLAYHCPRARMTEEEPDLTISGGSSSGIQRVCSLGRTGRREWTRTSLGRRSGRRRARLRGAGKRRLGPGPVLAVLVRDRAAPSWVWASAWVYRWSLMARMRASRH